MEGNGRTAAQAAAAQIISDYALEVHPEGGCFREVYTSAARTDAADGRQAGGSIYFLLQPGAVSHYHQIDCEEIWYYHEGAGLKVYLISPQGEVSVQKLGLDFAAGERPMVVIPQGTVFAAENIRADGYTFVSCATFPKFRYSGFRLVPYAELECYGVERRLCHE